MTIWAGSTATPRQASAGPVIDPSPELSALYGRVEKGITWLTEHDPAGAFNLWFESGLSPLSPMPAHGGEGDSTKADWLAYHAARQVFEQLWRKMVRLEKAASA